jgi:NADPH2:quinone reductase
MSLQVRSLVRPEGEVEIALHEAPPPAPGPDEVVVRIDAAPINPSDLGVLFARADLDTLRATGTPELPALTATVPAAAMPGLAARVGKALPVGNEGAGVVVAAGASPAAQALLGRTVGVYGGGTYAQHRVLPAAMCLALPEGLGAELGASNFVNPMTALAMLETMRREGHSAIVHTAAASNLGQMLVKLCAKEGVGLVNVVRRPEQVAALRALGAEHVVDSGTASFADDLVEAVARTGATLAFDAVGGGRLADAVLRAMERAASRDAARYSPYGSTTHKQVYVYGGLDRAPTTLARDYGMAWGVGGWLVGNALAKLGPGEVAALRQRVAAELGTTFASHYTRRVSLRELLDVEVLRQYAKMATGEKFLVVPGQGAATP